MFVFDDSSLNDTFNRSGYFYSNFLYRLSGIASTVLKFFCSSSLRLRLPRRQFELPDELPEPLTGLEGGEMAEKSVRLPRVSDDFSSCDMGSICI